MINFEIIEATNCSTVANGTINVLPRQGEYISIGSDRYKVEYIVYDFNKIQPNAVYVRIYCKVVC